MQIVQSKNSFEINKFYFIHFSFPNKLLHTCKVKPDLHSIIVISAKDNENDDSLPPPTKKP